MKYDVESIKKRKSINNRIKKIIFIFLVIVMYNITLLYMSYIDKFETPNFYIYKAYIITTTSMEPAINKDDVIIIKKCKGNELKIDDIVTFKQNGEIITHRIVDIIEAEEQQDINYITKGDNNNLDDEQPVIEENIEGKVIATIPYLGRIVKILKNGIIIILVILIFLITYLNKIESKEKSEERRKKKKIEDKKFFNE